MIYALIHNDNKVDSYQKWNDAKTARDALIAAHPTDRIYVTHISRIDATRTSYISDAIRAGLRYSHAAEAAVLCDRIEELGLRDAELAPRIVEWLARVLPGDEAASRARLALALGRVDHVAGNLRAALVYSGTYHTDVRGEFVDYSAQLFCGDRVVA